MHWSLRLAVVVFVSSPAWATTHTYSGSGTGSAPCNTTLQACLDGAASGDTVEIATNTLISESLTFNKSVTLQSATGFHGAIGSGSTSTFKSLTFADAASALTVTLDGLDLSGASVVGTLTATAGHVLKVRHSKLGDGVSLSWSKPLTLELRNNVILTSSDGDGSAVELRSSVTADGTNITVDGNELYSTTPASSYDAVNYYDNGSGGVTGTFTNNVIHELAGCGCGGTAVFDLRPTTTGTTTFYILNNTVDNVLSTGRAVETSAPSSGVMTLYIYNNTFSNMPTGYEFNSANAHVVIHYDYNNLFNISSSYTTGYTTGNGAHDTAVDPKFISASGHDYRLQSTSPLLGSGYSSAPQLPAAGFYGYARVSEGTVDKGAIERNADLAVSLSANPPTVAPGSDVTLTVAVENLGPYDVTGSSVSIQLPAGLIYKSSTLSGSCGGTSTLLCTLGAMARTTATNITVVATAEQQGDQTVSATVTGGPSDPVSTNDSASLTVGVHTPGGTADAGTHADGGTDGGKSGGCGCNAGGLDASVFGLFLLGVLALRRRW